MPTEIIGGTHAYVTGTARSTISFPLTTSKLSTALHLLDSTTSISAATSPSSTSSISPPPAYTTIYPPSPPSSLDESSTPVKTNYKNPLHSTLLLPSSPIRPLLTPRSSSDTSSSSPSISLLSTVFPSVSPIHTLPTEIINLDEISSNWNGVVVDNAKEGTRTLYVVGGGYEDVNMRESVCGVLELAEESLECTGVVMCLEKNSSDLGELIHQLLYVGGTITNLPFAPKDDWLLVGLDV